MTTIRSLIERLLASVPDLRGVYDEHISDNDELLPHVFFGDVTRFAIENAAAPSVASLWRCWIKLSPMPMRRSESRGGFVRGVPRRRNSSLKLMKPKMGLNLRRVFAAT